MSSKWDRSRKGKLSSSFELKLFRNCFILTEAQTSDISELATNPNNTYSTMNTSKSTTSFTGTSQRGDLEEALGHAIKQAMDSSQIADVLVTWTIEKISGRSGGIAGWREISITIAAKT